MGETRRVFFLLVLLKLLTTTDSHVVITFPKARQYALDFLDVIRTPPPCGIPKGAGPITNLKAGSRINVTWHTAYPHRGGYRINILDENEKELYQLTDRWMGLTNPTRIWREVTLPNITCKNCSIQLLREAGEWSAGSCNNGRYEFYSCADVNIIQRKPEGVIDCSGHGHLLDGQCYCNLRYSGSQCQYKDDCVVDADCINGGRCYDISTYYPKRQCFCAAGFYGNNCQHRSSVISMDDLDRKKYTKSVVPGTDDFSIYHYVDRESNEIEVMLEVNTTTWVGLGWRPQGLKSGCQHFPKLHPLPVPSPEGESQPEPEPHPKSEPNPQSKTKKPHPKAYAPVSEPEPGRTPEPEPHSKEAATPEPKKKSSSGKWCADRECQFQVSWSSNDTIINFVVQGRSDWERGWLAMGISNNRLMAGTDVYMAYTSLSKGVILSDRFSNARITPPVDKSEDASQFEFNSINDEITFSFSRALNTLDTDSDIAITGKHYLMLATGPVFNGKPLYHSRNKWASKQKQCLFNCAPGRGKRATGISKQYQDDGDPPCGGFQDPPVPKREPVGKSEPVPKGEPVGKHEPVPKGEPVGKSEPVPKGEPVGKHEPVPKGEPVGKSEPVPKGEPVAKHEPVPKGEPVGKHEPVPKGEPVGKHEPVPKGEPVGKHEPVPKGEPVGKHEPVPKGEPVGKHEPVPKDEPVGKSEPVPKGEPIGKSEPVPKGEPVSKHEPVPKGEPVGKSEPVPKGEPVGKHEPVPKGEPVGKHEPVPKGEPVGKSEPVPKGEPIGKSEPIPKGEPVGKHEPVPKGEPVGKGEPAPYEEPVGKHEPMPQGEPVGKGEPVPKGEPNGKSEPRPTDEPVGNSEPVPKGEPVSQHEPVTKGEPVRQTDGKPEPEPGAEGEPEGEGGSGSCGSLPAGNTPTTGNALHPMDCVDLVIGAARGEYSRIGDYYTRDRSTPQHDDFYGGEESLTAAIGRERNGVTSILFRRRLATSDDADHAFEDSPMHVIWARGQEEGAYHHNIRSGLDSPDLCPSDPHYYKQDELKYHGQNQDYRHRGSLTVNFLENSVVATPPTGPPSCNGQWKSCPGSDCSYTATWTVDMNARAVTFTLQAKLSSSRKEWLAIGISPDTRMAETDAYIGWVEQTGRVTVTDRWITGYSAQPEDTIPSVYDVSGGLQNGVTTVQFTRLLDTGDADQDFIFSGSACAYFLFAWGGEVSGNNLRRHREKRATTEKICLTNCRPSVTTALPKAPTYIIQREVWTSIKLTNATFTSKYLSPYTREYRHLKNTLMPDLIKVFQRLPGFKKVEIKSFRFGSVIVVAAVTVQGSGESIDAAALAIKARVMEALKTAVLGKMLGGYHVDENYAAVDFPQRVLGNPGAQTCKGQWKSCAGASCTFSARWSVDMYARTITFTLQARLDTSKQHWLAVGISADGYMPESDAYICWVDKSGSVTVSDRWMHGYIEPVEDSINSTITGVSGRIENGMTTVQFTRPLDTGDPREDFIFDGTRCACFFFSWGGLVVGRNHLTKHKYKHVWDTQFCYPDCRKGMATVTTTVQPFSIQRVVHFTFRLSGRPFLDNYRFRNSAEYKRLERLILSDLNRLFRHRLGGYNKIMIHRFRPGSIIVDADVEIIGSGTNVSEIETDMKYGVKDVLVEYVTSKSTGSYAKFETFVEVNDPHTAARSPSFWKEEVEMTTLGKTAISLCAIFFILIIIVAIKCVCTPRRPTKNGKSVVAVCEQKQINCLSRSSEQD